MAEQTIYMHYQLTVRPLALLLQKFEARDGGRRLRHQFITCS